MRDLLPVNISVPLHIALMGLVFFVLFIGIVVFVYSKHRKKTYERVQNLPLED